MKPAARSPQPAAIQAERPHPMSVPISTEDLNATVETLAGRISAIKERL
jgi:hypothetical protein